MTKHIEMIFRLLFSEFSIKLNELQKTDEWVNRGENKVKDVEAEFVCSFCENFPI